MKEVITQVEGKLVEHQEEAIHQAKTLTEIEKTLIEEERDLPAQEMTETGEKTAMMEEALAMPENELLRGTLMGMQHLCMMKIFNSNTVWNHLYY